MTTRPTVADGIDWIELDGEVVILSPERLHFLDHSGTLVWRMIVAGVDNVPAAMEQQHGAQAASDTTNFLAALLNAGVLQTVPPAGPQVRIAPHVAWAVDESGIVVVSDLRNGRRTALLASAGAIWRAIGDGATESDVVRTVAAESGVQPELVTSDVLALLGRLLGDGLLRTSAISAPLSGSGKKVVNQSEIG